MHKQFINSQLSFPFSSLNTIFVKIMKIIRYTHNYKSQWDEFVNVSKNGTFLHLRDFMDYHSDRFDDYSLMCIDDAGRIIAALPANVCGDTLYSHQGLTYGGWIMTVKGFTASTMLDVWQIMNDYLKQAGIKHIIYKPTPHIYHRYPAEEDLYAIFRNNGSILSTQVSSTIKLGASRVLFNENARRGLKSAVSNGVQVSESDDFDGYWTILSDMLKECHNTKPVHSIDEIKLLHSRFPNNIKLYVATHNDEIVAGVVMFYTHTVAHAQYIAASARGKELKALPLLFNYIIEYDSAQYQYFDFGTSNEDGGHYLNHGLITQKCGMGGRAIVYNTYQLSLNNN